ncbi:MAG: efflux RND transporter periplasmic adaptor subunit [Chloroflexi bacterium]|uniref:efflux RND transporter periplasmic adaptor subunit n=1 Tax=Candidatus Flexifilum breve TaxID=3140694 RepID=UPI003134EFDA|nr:efflux RND transporter periplasmic adaptor subunit [Chloroflexota bacterium]
MSVSRSIFVLIIVTLGLPLVAFGLRANQAQSSASAAPQVEQYIVGRGAVELSVSALGTMQPDQTAALSFTIPGRITEIPVVVGQAVTPGDVLLVQADEPLRIAYQQAELALMSAQLQLDDVLDGPDEGEITIARANVTAAQSAVGAVQGAVSSADLQTAQLSYQQAQAAVAAAQEARATAPGGQDQAAYDLLDARIGQASFNAEIARLQVERLQSGNPAAVGAAAARVAQAQAELDRLLAGPTQAEIDRAAAGVDRAQLALDQAQAAWDRARLVAPFAGIISALNTEIGALVAPGFAVVELTDATPLHLTVQVDEIDVRQIVTGMPARITLDALPEVELPGVVDEIALVATNESGIVSFDVRLHVDATDPRLRVGMTAEANIIIEAEADALIVPNQYIRLDRAQGDAYVNLLQPDGTLLEIPVTLGLQGQDVSQVIAGLTEGAVIGVDLAGDSLSIFGG